MQSQKKLSDLRSPISKYEGTGNPIGSDRPQRVGNSKISTSAASRGNSKPLAKLLRELVRTQRFESYDSLKAALRGRCRQLRIPVTHADVDDAISLVESNTWLVRPPAAKPKLAPPVAESPTLVGRREAAKLLTGIFEKTGVTWALGGFA